eukprot:12825706-Alexandrium_andersonii.AAC.1
MLLDPHVRSRWIRREEGDLLVAPGVDPHPQAQADAFAASLYALRCPGGDDSRAPLAPHVEDWLTRAAVPAPELRVTCLLYTSDAADDM